MIIEKYLVRYLSSALACPVFAEEPERPPSSYILVEKLGSSIENLITASTVAVQSYAKSKLAAVELNEQVKAVMEQLVSEPEISRARLNSDYSFTDTSTKRHRYQAVFDITHY